jgi:hypothetical protein
MDHKAVAITLNGGTQVSEPAAIAVLYGWFLASGSAIPQH